MKNGSQEREWQKLLDIWVNSQQTREIHSQLLRSLEEVKAKSSRFEKNHIKRGLTSLKNSWFAFRKTVGQFEEDAVKRDLTLVNRSLKKFFV